MLLTGHIDGEIRHERSFRDPVSGEQFPYDTQNYSIEVGLFPQHVQWLEYKFLFNSRLFSVWGKEGVRHRSDQVRVQVVAWGGGV